MSAASVETVLYEILEAALIALESIPQTAAAAATIQAFVLIIQKTVTAIQTATGQPLDLTKIPIETPLP